MAEGGLMLEDSQGTREDVWEERIGEEAEMFWLRLRLLYWHFWGSIWVDCTTEVGEMWHRYGVRGRMGLRSRVRSNGVGDEANKRENDFLMWRTSLVLYTSIACDARKGNIETRLFYRLYLINDLQLI